jgi:hypothetical protein
MSDSLKKSQRHRKTIPTEGQFRVFSLEDCGISQEEFLNFVRPSFDLLPWDYYDVRREQMDILKNEGLLENDSNQRLAQQYYTGAVQLSALREMINRLPEDRQEQLLTIKPYRQKSVATLILSRKPTGDWEFQRTTNLGVTQDVPGEDFRSIERVYPETAEEVTSHPLYHRLLSNVASFVEEAEACVKKLELTCWQMATITSGSAAKSNSPEGIHQDGADYIVSALVVGRENVRGGCSRIFADDKQTVILEETLEPGLGLFQEDSGSPLWHDVTPIEAADPESGEGKRELIGFDIKVLE